MRPSDYVRDSHPLCEKLHSICPRQIMTKEDVIVFCETRQHTEITEPGGYLRFENEALKIPLGKTAGQIPWAPDFIFWLSPWDHSSCQADTSLHFPPEPEQIWGGGVDPKEVDFRFKNPTIVSLDLLAGVQVQKEACLLVENPRSVAWPQWAEKIHAYLQTFLHPPQNREERAKCQLHSVWKRSHAGGKMRAGLYLFPKKDSCGFPGLMEPNWEERTPKKDSPSQ